jgi:hypothetical protein
MYRFSQTFFLKLRNIVADSISFGIKINEVQLFVDNH